MNTEISYKKLSIVGEYQIRTGRLIPPVDKEWNYIYFVEAISTDRIKIGTTKNPNTRFDLMKTDCPFPLYVHLIMALPQQYEKFLHAIFQEYRLHGEWFEKTAKLLEFIDICNQRHDGDTYDYINKNHADIVGGGEWAMGGNPQFYDYLTNKNNRI